MAIFNNPREREAAAAKLFKQATELHKAGQFTEAQNIYFQILKFHPTHYGVLHYLGVLAYQHQNYPEAEKYFLKSLALNRESSDGFFSLGNTLKLQGKFMDAATAFRKSLALKEDDHECHYCLGQTLEEMGKCEEAKESYARAVILKEDYQEAMDALNALVLKTQSQG